MTPEAKREYARQYREKNRERIRKLHTERARRERENERKKDYNAASAKADYVSLARLVGERNDAHRQKLANLVARDRAYAAAGFNISVTRRVTKDGMIEYRRR